jgi:hypothetical protein
MPRGGHRYGAGRPGWKAKAEQSLPLDVRRMHRAGVLWAGYRGSWKWTNSYTDEFVGRIGFTAERGGLALSYLLDGEPRDQYVPLTETPCHFGGVRQWFICPIGGERVAVLYMNRGRFACRRCNCIAYLSQSDDLSGRAWRKQSKLEHRLGDDWQRPKGMHRVTYERLLSKVWECEMVRDGLLYLKFQRWGWMSP